AGIVWAGGIDYGQPESRGLRFPRPRDVDMYAIFSAVTVGIKRCLHPEVVLYPVVRVSKLRHDLRFAILKYGYHLRAHPADAGHCQQKEYVKGMLSDHSVCGHINVND